MWLSLPAILCSSPRTWHENKGFFHLVPHHVNHTLKSAWSTIGIQKVDRICDWMNEWCTRLGFLNLSTLDSLGQITVGCGGVWGGEAVSCIQSCVTASLTCTHWHPLAPTSPSQDNQKYLQMLPYGPWGAKSPQMRTMHYTLSSQMEGTASKTIGYLVSTHRCSINVYWRKRD